MTMMKLLYQTHSPYARKVLVFAHEARVANQMEVIHHETSPLRRNEVVFAQNPLGKVPALVRPGLASIFDSDVICAYLDTLHDGRKLIPVEGEARWQALRVQAIAQGLAEAGVAIRWETTRRPEPLRYGPLCEGYTEKLITAYDWLERELDTVSPTHVGHIALATTLSWIAFRELPVWGKNHPRLAAWFEEFENRPSMLATPLSGETHD
jgi:glutathione S-transferase